MAKTSVIWQGNKELLVETSKRVPRISMLEHVACFQSTILWPEALLRRLRTGRSKSIILSFGGP